MNEGATLDIDYTGSQGGLLALAFAAGCVACFSFCALIGGFMWKILGKAKDDEIARLNRAAQEHHERCTEMETRLVARIQNLEGALLSAGLLRQQVQGVISEHRLETDRSKK